MEKEVVARSLGKCEICLSENSLSVYEVEPANNIGADAYLNICSTCLSQYKKEAEIDANHWRCLNDSIWSEVPAVKVVSWRMLHRLKSEGWPQDLLDMMYLEDEHLSWARATGEDSDEEQAVHKDSNGAILENGDSVVLIKDLNVKGAGFTAKRGTAVRNITLVQDNPEHIEGKVEGQRIVILTQYVKK